MTEQKVSTDINSAPDKNTARNLFFHAFDIISNHGIFIPGNSNGFRGKFVSGIVIHPTGNVDQLIWIEKVGNGVCFSINAFQGHDNVSQRLYLISSTNCFDSDGEPVDEEKARDVSKLLGFIGKSLSRDLDKP